MNLCILGSSPSYMGWGFVYDSDSGSVYALPSIYDDGNMVTLIPVSTVMMEAATTDANIEEDIMNSYDAQLAIILG